MKQTFTLFVMGILCLCASKTFAQINQGFEPVSGGSPLPSSTSNCWTFTNATWDNTAQITGTGSLYIKPTGTINATTPFIDFQTGNVVSIKYKLDSKLANSATRIIALSLVDRNGSSTALTSITLDNSVAAKNVFTLTYTITASNPGTQRLAIDIKGAGDGKTGIFIDDISVVKNPDPLVTVNPAFHYSPSNCNSAPVAGDNTYNAPSNTATYSGTTVLSNDTDPDGESLTAAVATQSLDGLVVMNLDGTFTFTPNAGFTGSFTSFTYTVTDNGYSRLSTTATVTIYFPQVSTLPVKLIRFSGVLNTKTNLAWTVAANETGRLFEVQRSNGGAFQSIATVFATEVSGDVQYQFTDALPTQATSYRLKIVNKDGTFFFSPVVSFKAAAETSKITLLQNPVQNTLRFSVPATSRVSGIAIYNMAGGIVYSEKVEKGNNVISLPLQANLPRGTYVLQVLTDNGAKTATFVKQ